MLNRINDEAATELKQFYREQLAAGAKGSGEYEAHLSIGLLLWRNSGGVGSENINYHLAQAARCVACLYEQRKNRDERDDNDLFEFMIPLFLVLIFGDRETRQRMAGMERAYWASEQPTEFQSMILFLDLLRRHLVEVRFPENEVNNVLTANGDPQTHPFYQPWIEAFCSGILAINARDAESTGRACEELVRLHRAEALNGDWQLRVEGLLSFWGCGLVKIARQSGLDFHPRSEYLYLAAC